MGYEWVSAHIFLLIDQYDINIENIIATCVEHFSHQIYCAIDNAHSKGGLVLMTGGGTFNDFFVEGISSKSDNHVEIVIPDQNTISYKEAIIFGLLGVLKYQREINCLSSVTGAERDNCGGLIHRVTS